LSQKRRQKLGSSPLVYGWLTAELNAELKKLLEEEEWPPPEEAPEEFNIVLQVCDYAFLLKELKRKCDELGLNKSGHKKILAARLLQAGEEELTELARKVVQEVEAGEQDPFVIAGKIVG